jgi:hypothetical protein
VLRGGRDGGASGEASGRALSGGRGGGGTSEAGLSGRAACCPDSGFKPRATARRVAATRQRRAAMRVRRGARRLTGGARSSAISELKFTPKENSSKQKSRN